MHSVNQATLLGNLTRDPELRYTPNGSPVISFAVATNRYWKNDAGEKQEAVDYHNIVFWGKAAEIIAQFVTKGDKIYIQGRIQTRSWEGKDKVKRYSTEIVGRDFILLSPRKKVETTAKPAEVKPTESAEKPPAEPAQSEKKEVVNADDIPF